MIATACRCQRNGGRHDPAAERDRPDSFISRVQQLPVPMLPTEARVQINEATAR